MKSVSPNENATRPLPAIPRSTQHAPLPPIHSLRLRLSSSIHRALPLLCSQRVERSIRDEQQQQQQQQQQTQGGIGARASPSRYGGVAADEQLVNAYMAELEQTLPR